MCVILLVETVRPDETQISRMWESNSRGGGGASWREGPEDDRVVKWRKGLTKEEMVSLNQTLPQPYILHFRQPSADTSDSLLACHPFQVDAEATTGFSGTTSGHVLFHNGFWTGWRSKLESFALAAYGTPGFAGLPEGPWSDSRGLAMMAYFLKWGFLEMANEKVLCMGPGEADLRMFGGTWFKERPPGEKDAFFIVSNLTWRTVTAGFTSHDRRHHAQSDTTKLLDAAKSTITPDGKSGGASQPGSFPCKNGRAESAEGSGGHQRGHQQERVQASDESALEGDGGGGASGQPGSLICNGCQQYKPAGLFVKGTSWYCYQCWSALPAIVPSGPSRAARSSGLDLWVGTCSRCKVGSAGMRTVKEHEWICMACFETNGRPQVYYARERGAA